MFTVYMIIYLGIVLYPLYTHVSTILHVIYDVYACMLES